MFGSQVLEVMIGLLLIYLALSVACSGIKEVIASIFALRAKTLESALENMLQDPNLVNQLFQHPVIAGTAPSGQKPSYISSRNFAIALLDVITTSAGASTASVGEIPNAPNPPSVLSSFQNLQAAVERLPSKQLRKTLSAVIDSAHGDVQAAQQRIETWFDDTMQRVSGWYKRTAQRIIFCVGLALCVALNADTFSLAKDLWSDQALREAVAAQASAYAGRGNPVARLAAADSSQPIVQEAKQVADDVRIAQPLPLGWDGFSGLRGALLTWPGGLLKFLGILVSSFAILMGAPFWFDMLNKLINLRLSGDPPAASS